MTLISLIIGPISIYCLYIALMDYLFNYKMPLFNGFFRQPIVVILSVIGSVIGVLGL